MADSQTAITDLPVESVETIPLSRIGGYPPFLTRDDGAADITHPFSLPDLRHLRSLARFTPEHRARLVDALLNDLKRWNAPAAALASVEALREMNVYAVVTGQQAGITGGPLYTLYKGVGAVRAADELARRHSGHRFVPVFWIEADDHDFDEVRTITVLDQGGSPVTLAYDDGDSRPLHVGDRKNDSAGIAVLEAALREALPPTEFTDEAIRILLDSYRTDGETLADGFARFFYAILGDTPLVLLSSRNPALKALAADIFAREAADPNLLFNAIEERTKAVAAEGMPTPIAPKPGALFLTHEGERRSLDIDGEGYLIKGTDRRLSFADAAELARTNPERFSPKVVLRPIVQDAILPSAVYLGGPSEMAYLNQIVPAYPLFGIDSPGIAPRPFVVIVEPKVRRVIDTTGIALDRLLAEKFDAADILVDKEIEGELEGVKEKALKMIQEAYGELEEVTRRIDPTLEKTLGAAAANAGKGIDDLARRLGSALKKKQQTGIDRLNGARTLLAPGGALQERTLNALYFIDKYGVERFRKVLGMIGYRECAVQIVEV